MALPAMSEEQDKAWSAAEQLTNGFQPELICGLFEGGDEVLGGLSAPQFCYAEKSPDPFGGTKRFPWYRVMRGSEVLYDFLPAPEVAITFASKINIGAM